MQRFNAGFFQFFFDLFEKLPICRWSFVNTPEQSLQLKWRTTHEKNFSSSLSNSFNGLMRLLNVLREAEVLIWGDNIQQVMGDQCALLCRRFGSSNIHLLVDGH